MADTQHTLTQLKALLADNVNGDISPQDIRDFLVTVMGCYGCIYTNSGSGTQSVSSAAAVVLDQFDSDGPNDGSSGVESDAANNKIILHIAGTYRIAFDITYESDAPSGVTYTVGALLDAGAISGLVTKSEHHDDLTTYIVHCEMLVVVTEDQEITVQVASDNVNSYTFDVKYASLIAKMLA